MFITAESKHGSSACGVPVQNTGYYSHKNLLAHSRDFLIFSCLQLENFILQVEGRVVPLFVIEQNKDET